ncbi:hypothetical protein ACFVIM_23640 [Streptomyces sp. NPDC057638]|uniref:hypothetical protein n=1 Tax=Streptomyces sp. NPDC057638 TaxID=3346190 RepID=UPI0036766FA3
MTRQVNLLPNSDINPDARLVRRRAKAANPPVRKRPPGLAEVLAALAAGATTTEAAHALGLKVGDLAPLLARTGVRTGAGIPSALHTAYSSRTLAPPAAEPVPAGIGADEIRLWHALATEPTSAGVARAAGLPHAAVHRAIQRLRHRAGARTSGELIRIGHATGLLAPSVPQYRR